MAEFDLEVMKFDCQTTIKVVGVGGGGCNAVRTMIGDGVEGADFLVMNTDMQALNDSPCEHRVQLGERLTRGLGAGANPDVGRKAALEDVNRISEVVQGVDMVFITAGMGGGTGTGAAPIVAQAAKEAGALTVAVVTRPFGFEGRRRTRAADEGLANLAPNVDALIVLPNDKLLDLDANLTAADAFRQADSVLSTSVRGITEIIQVSGRINVDFADVRTTLCGAGPCVMGQGEARGERRAVEAMQAAVCSPFLEESSLRGATRVLVNFLGGSNMKLSEIREAMDYLRDQVHEDADVIMGQVELPDHEDSIRVTVIATGFRREGDHAVVGARAATTQPQAAAQPRTAQYPIVGAYEMPAPAQRPRVSSTPPPRRTAAQAAAEARASQMPLIASGTMADEILDIPTYLRRQPE
ncbi:MAG: cell division protein FtsZ [Deltaproteobacteria bacterium]|nr:cell division protein FtsZ [Deltaproteobacteria bacterium]